MGEPGIRDVIRDLEKSYGIKVVTLDENERTYDVDVIPSGILSLDIATGIGGIPRGYYTEVYSPDAVGKTTLCIHLVAEAQKLGLPAAFIDMEHRFDPFWASKIGVDLSQLLFTQPPYGEAALNAAHALVEHGGVKLVIIDSIPALVPKKELEGETGDEFVGLQPRIIAQYFRQMTPILKKSNAAVVFTNQIRSEIGGMASLAMGARQRTPGGWAVKFYTSMRLDLRRTKQVKTTTGDSIGHIVKVTIKKNSLAVPMRVTEIYLKYDAGFDRAENLIDLAMGAGMIEQSGSWYTVPGGEKVQGRIAVCEHLYDNPDQLEALEAKLRSMYLPGANDNGS